MTAPAPPSTLIVACGALARELLAVVERQGWSHMSVTCLPADLHNHPEKIPEAVREKIRKNRDAYDRILCLYGDCGTGGQLDRVLAEEGVARIEGTHCYAFYTGLASFEAMSEAEPASFYLTDYLVRHFDRLVIEGLGLDRFPQLRDDYFGNYRRVVYLAQTDDAELTARAEAAARRLGLAFERRETGLDEVEAFLARANADEGKEAGRGPAPRHPLA